MTILIDADLCSGCKRCEKTCPYGGVEVVDGKAHILERCTSCGACIEACKEKAIVSDAEPRVIPDFSDRKGVWVFAEQRQGVLGKISLELLGKAQELAETLNQEVSAILLGNHVANLADELMEYGADRVYLAEDPDLMDYRTGAYCKVIGEMVEKYKPNILLMGATHIGRDLAPRVSRRVGVGLTADCTELTIDPEEGLLLADKACLWWKRHGDHCQSVFPPADGYREAGGDGSAKESKGKCGLYFAQDHVHRGRDRNDGPGDRQGKEEGCGSCGGQNHCCRRQRGRG